MASVLGLFAMLVALGAGVFLSRRVLAIAGLPEAIAVGLGLGVALYLLALSLLLNAGIGLGKAALLAPLFTALLAALGARRPDQERPGSDLTRAEKVGLPLAVLAVWLFTNMMQVIVVDDDYWLHTPVQGRMLRGILPPTNPFFPDLVLGGHFGRDMLVVSTSVLTGRDVFGAQILLTSFCHSLGLALLYLALRRSGNAVSATAGTTMAWLGMNVAHRCGLADFYQNNGGPTYLILALLLYLLSELWRQPGRKLALLCGLVLGIYALVYETHFGLVGLTVLTMMPLISRPAKLASLLALAVAAVLAVTTGGALARLARPVARPLDTAIANQSQSVEISFPKNPFLALRIQVGEIDPVSLGYTVGLGKAILRAVDHTPERSDPRYVSLWSWNVLRMHWLGVWMAPLSLFLLIRARHRAGLFLGIFGVWAFLVPGMVDFGPVHEFEWYRWEFAAGFGLAAAFGVALGTLARGWRTTLAIGLTVALTCQAGFSYLWNFGQHLTNPRASEILGYRFHSTDWLLRHGDQLRFRESDFRALSWIWVNGEQGNGCLVFTTGIPEAWGILFESTAMALVDIQVLGHQLPPKGEPVGVPPFRINEECHEFLAQPNLAWSKQLGIDWLLLRSDDLGLESRLATVLPLVYFDGLALDGKRRLLFASPKNSLRRPPELLVSAHGMALNLEKLPPGTERIAVDYLDDAAGRLAEPSWLPPVTTTTIAVPRGCRSLELTFMAQGKVVGRQVKPVTPRGADQP